MVLKIVKNGVILPPSECQFFELNNFCTQMGRDLTLEWIDGQYWLHSDIPKERPIGIQIDSVLERHELALKKSGIQKELLARAVGIKGSYRPQVLDLTAGMLGDSLLLLSFGCEVQAVERHPVIRFLIRDALRNAKHPLTKKLHFLEADAQTLLAQNPVVDVLFFDPMFEDVNENVRPKKEMRIFRDLVGKDLDAKDVFQQALGLKIKRLVVKRPRHSQYLEKKPDVQYVGKATRYDVYFSL